MRRILKLCVDESRYYQRWLAGKRKRSGGGRAFHSRLESFVEFIREQRQRRRTWREIAALLSSEKGCAITTQGVHQFYRRYSHRRAQMHWEETSSVSIATATPIGIAPARKIILARNAAICVKFAGQIPKT